jgi:hypothetical protein
MRPNLIGLRDTMAAQLIMTFHDMYSHYKSSEVVKIMLAVRRDCYPLAITDVYDWGKCIRQEYIAKNAEARCDGTAASMSEAITQLGESK